MIQTHETISKEYFFFPMIRGVRTNLRRNEKRNNAPTALHRGQSVRIKSKPFVRKWTRPNQPAAVHYVTLRARNISNILLLSPQSLYSVSASTLRHDSKPHTHNFDQLLVPWWAWYVSKTSKSSRRPAPLGRSKLFIHAFISDSIQITPITDRVQRTKHTRTSPHSTLSSPPYIYTQHHTTHHSIHRRSENLHSHRLTNILLIAQQTNKSITPVQ